ncbi:MAG: hypothetical protein ACRD12_03855 [Acidimicrobiales bacterium]
MSARFDIRLDGDEFSGGDTVKGAVVVAWGAKARSLQVLLEFHEGTNEFETVVGAVSSGPLHEGDLEPGMAFPFALTLPGGAYPNFRSAHGRLYWDIHVHSDELGIDSHERRPVSVVPKR